jgi:anaerobic selenocysteine-containing dehydrogenase
MAGAQVRTERSVCRVCASLCGILVDMEGERVVKVRGDRDHPLSHGYTCPKGRALPQMHHHPQRIERPLVRVDGELKPTTWEHALDDLAAKLRTVIDRHGPSSVGVYYGSGLGMDGAGFRMGQALVNAIGTRALFSPLTIDHAAKVLSQTLMMGTPLLYPRLDYDHVDLLVYVGSNPMISHGHPVAIPNPARMIRAVAARGELWVLDPHRTETAGFATRHMAPRPGSDYAVFAYLVREILRDGANPDALARSTGVEALREAVEPFDRARAAEVAGVAPQDLSDLLAAVRKSGRLAVEIGTGVSMSADTGNLTVWLAWALMVITDSMNRRGGMWFHPGFFERLDGAPLPVITEPFAPGPKSRPDLQSFIGDWPCAAVPDEIEAGEMHAFLNFGGAMMRSFPDANALEAALRKLDVFMTLEIIENDTSALSTHVLPTKDQLERPDVVLWDFISSRINGNYTPAMVEPVGDRRAAWWVLSQLMRRLDYDLPFAVPDDPRSAEADEQVLRAVTASGRCSFEELTSRRYVDKTDELELPAPWVEDHMARFGGWQVAPPLLVDLLAATTRAASAAGALTLIPRRQRRHINAWFTFLGDTPDILLHPGDAEAAGVEDGRPVIIRSGRGEIVGKARLDEKMRPGVVSVPHGYEEANVNRLTSTRQVDAITGMAVYGGFPVTIHPGVEAPAPEPAAP